MEHWAGIRLESDAARRHRAQAVDQALRDGFDVLEVFPEVAGQGAPSLEAAWLRAQWRARVCVLQFGDKELNEMRRSNLEPPVDCFLPFLEETLTHHVRVYEKRPGCANGGDESIIYQVEFDVSEGSARQGGFSPRISSPECVAATVALSTWPFHGPHSDFTLSEPGSRCGHDRQFRWIVVDVVNGFAGDTDQGSLAWCFRKFMGTEADPAALQFTRLGPGMAAASGLEGAVVVRDVSQYVAHWSLGLSLESTDAVWGGELWWLFVFRVFQRHAIERIAYQAASTQAQQAPSEEAGLDRLLRIAMFLENRWAYREAARATTSDAFYRQTGDALNLPRMWTDVQAQAHMLVNERRRRHDQQLQELARTFAVLSIAVAVLVGVLALSPQSSRVIVDSLLTVFSHVERWPTLGPLYELERAWIDWATGVALLVCAASPLALFYAFRVRGHFLRRCIFYMTLFAFYALCALLVYRIGVSGS